MSSYYGGGGGQLASYAAARDSSMNDAFQFAIQIIMERRRRKAEEAMGIADMAVRQGNEGRRFELDLAREQRAQSEAALDREFKEDQAKRQREVSDRDYALSLRKAEASIAESRARADKARRPVAAKDAAAAEVGKNRRAFLGARISDIGAKIKDTETAITNILKASPGDRQATRAQEVKLEKLNRARVHLVNSLAAIDSGDTLGPKWNDVVLAASDPVMWDEVQKQRTLADERFRKSSTAAAVVTGKQAKAAGGGDGDNTSQYPAAPAGAAEGARVRSKKTGEIRVVKNGRLVPIE